MFKEYIIVIEYLFTLQRHRRRLQLDGQFNSNAAAHCRHEPPRETGISFMLDQTCSYLDPVILFFADSSVFILKSIRYS